MTVIPIIIVTHNNADTLEYCFKSLNNLKSPQGRELKIVVVDNASKDRTPELLRKFQKDSIFEVNVLYLDKNYGFSKGVLIGLMKAKPKDYFVLLNPDTISTSDWIVKLYEVLEKDMRIGVAQPLLVRPSGEIDCAGGFLNILGYPRELKFVRSRTLYDVDYAKGAAVLMRTVAYKKAGGLDPLFFFYYDEADLSIRMKKEGYRVVVVPDAIVFHVGLGSRIPHKRLFVLYYMERNRLLYLYKNQRIRFPLAFTYTIASIVKSGGVDRKIKTKALRDFIRIIKGVNVREPFDLCEVMRDLCMRR